MTLTQKATFGGGCFWCTEAVFKSIRGVESVTSGYMGGKTKFPTYEEVCNGDTGHVEVIEIAFDDHEVSFEDLLLVFLKTHDPTTINRQGNDVGKQYRSVIFYHNDLQKEQAENMIARLTAEHVFDRPIVTAVEEAKEFFPAEDYHQDYYRQNERQPYCAAVITPKMAKFTKEFKGLLK